MSVSLSNGVSLTVSTESLESKIEAATGKFVKNLSKSQKALGMTIDEFDRYVNANGKLVEGLTQAQIKMGQYVDEMGKLHTENGGFVSDLNKIEQALGFYADEFGVVRNAQHEVIRLTAEARKEIALKKAEAEKAEKIEVDAERKKQAEIERTARIAKEEREESQRYVQLVGQTFGAFSQISGQFASLLASIECTDDAVGGFRSTLIQVSEAAAVGFGTFQSVYLAFNNITKGLSTAKAGLVSTASVAGPASAALTGVGTAATTASVGVKALQVACGPVGMTLAAITAAVSAFITTSHKSADDVSNLSEHFKELEKRANAVNRSINSLKDALEFGAFQLPTSEFQNAAKALDDAREQLQKAIYNGYERGWGQKGANAAIEAFRQPDSAIDYKAMVDSLKRLDKKDAKPLLEEYQNQLASMDEYIAGVFKTARDSVQTESEKLEKEMNNIANVAELVRSKGDREGYNLLADYYGQLDDKLKAAKEKETQEAEKAAKAEQDKVLESLGALEYVQKAGEAQKKTVDSIDDFYRLVEKEWGDAFESGVMSTKEYGDAVAGLARSFQPVDMSDFLEIRDTLRDAYEQQIMSVDQASDAFEELKRNAQNIFKAKYDLDLEPPKFDANSVHGVNAALDDLRLALNEGIISQEQFNAGADRLAQRMTDVVLDGFEKGESSFQKAVEELNAAFFSGAISFQECVDAIEDLEGRAKNALSNELGVSFKGLELDYSAKLDKLQKAFDDDVLTKNEYEDAKKQLVDAARKAIPGVDSLVSTAEASFKETIEQLKKAFDDNIIEQDEYNQLVQDAKAKLAEAYEKESKKVESYDDEAMKKAWERFQKDEAKRKTVEKKTEPAKSSSSGSEALYLAQVKNSTANFQSKVQSTTENIYRTGREALWQSQQTNLYLQELVENAGPAVFG